MPNCFRWTQISPVTENHTPWARAGLDNRARQIYTVIAFAAITHRFEANKPNSATFHLRQRQRFVGRHVSPNSIVGYGAGKLSKTPQSSRFLQLTQGSVYLPCGGQLDWGRVGHESCTPCISLSFNCNNNSTPFVVSTLLLIPNGPMTQSRSFFVYDWECSEEPCSNYFLISALPSSCITINKYSWI